MNERIKELAEQAGLLGPTSRVGNAHEAAERFAELVQEDERNKFVNFLMQLHKQYKHQHNHFHVAAVNFWESKHD